MALQNDDANCQLVLQCCRIQEARLEVGNYSWEGRGQVVPVNNFAAMKTIEEIGTGTDVLVV